MAGFFTDKPGASGFLSNIGMALLSAGQGGGAPRPRFGPQEMSLMQRGFAAPGQARQQQKQAALQKLQMTNATNQQKLFPGQMAAQGQKSRAANLDYDTEKQKLDANAQIKAMIFKKLGIPSPGPQADMQGAGQPIQGTETLPAQTMNSPAMMSQDLIGGVGDDDLSTPALTPQTPDLTGQVAGDTLQPTPDDPLAGLSKQQLLAIGMSPDPMAALSKLLTKGVKSDDRSNPGEYRTPDDKVVRGWFNKSKGRFEYRDAGNSVKRVPPGSRKITPTSSGRELMKPGDLMNLRKDMNDTENGVKQISRYMKGVQKTGQGIDLLTKKWSGKIKTIFGKMPTEGELSLMVQNGQIQGLLGKFRKEVVGGGVMTEQDALRILSALGGEPNPTRHPEIVRRLLSDIVGQKVNSYNSVMLPMMNDQARRGSVYKKRKELTVPGVFNSGASALKQKYGLE